MWSALNPLEHNRTTLLFRHISFHSSSLYNDCSLHGWSSAHLAFAARVPLSSTLPLLPTVVLCSYSCTRREISIPDINLCSRFSRAPLCWLKKEMMSNLGRWCVMFIQFEQHTFIHSNTHMMLVYKNSTEMSVIFMESSQLFFNIKLCLSRNLNSEGAFWIHRLQWFMESKFKAGIMIRSEFPIARSSSSPAVFVRN